jgi:hypothetical protein
MLRFDVTKSRHAWSWPLDACQWSMPRTIMADHPANYYLEMQYPASRQLPSDKHQTLRVHIRGETAVFCFSVLSSFLSNSSRLVAEKIFFFDLLLFISDQVRIIVLRRIDTLEITNWPCICLNSKVLSRYYNGTRRLWHFRNFSTASTRWSNEIAQRGASDKRFGESSRAFFFFLFWETSKSPRWPNQAAL